MFQRNQLPLSQEVQLKVVKGSAIALLLSLPAFVFAQESSLRPLALSLPGVIASLIFWVLAQTRVGVWLGGVAVVILTGLGWIAFITARPENVEEMTFFYVVAGNILACGVAVLTGFSDLGYRLYRRLRKPQHT